MGHVEPPDTDSAVTRTARECLRAGGAAGELLRAFDWRESSLGDPEHWPAPLRTVVGLMLASRFPMFVAWGPELVLLYNDAYAGMLGDRHPRALGQPFREVWPDLWTDVAPLVDAARGGDASYVQDLPLLVNRRGLDERASFTFSYSPVLDDSGAVSGLLCVLSETTEQVRAQRRQAFHLALEERLRLLSAPRDLMAAAAEVLGRELGVERVGYGEMDAHGCMLIEADWTDGTLPSLVGLLNVREQNPRVLDHFVEGLPVAADDVRDDPRMSEQAVAAFEVIGVRATLAVPLKKSDRLVAVLYLHSPRVRLWREDEIRLAGEVAERTWAVVERARAETLLRDREELLRLAIESAEVGLWHVDMLQGRLMWPARVKAMFGLSADAAVSGELFLSTLHPDDRPMIESAFLRAADPAIRASYDVEYRAIGHDDGKLRWIAAKGRGVFDEEGRCLRVLGTAIDITRRKADEARLRELNETLERRFAETLAERKLLADIVEGTDLFVQVADRDFNWLAINRASALELSRLFDVPPPKAGDNMLVALAAHPEAQEGTRAIWSRALAGEEFVEVGSFAAADPVARRDYEMHFRTLRDDHGNIIGAYQFVHDVTERLRAQSRLRQAEAALIQVQKMDAVGQLTGGIAHDFNNLLSAIVGNFELVRVRADDPEWVRRFALSGLQVAQRGAKLTSQLLTFSRSQAIELRVFDAAATVSDMRDLLTRTLGALIRLKFDIEPRPFPVRSDPTQIEMAVLNLAINARDAMAGGGTLTISVQQRKLAREGTLEAGDYVEIGVADDGIGMSPEVVAHAFDPFYTTKGVGAGTGLGLSQVYAIARQSGGEARIESSEGVGTVVRLLLPLSLTAAPVDRPAEHAAHAPGARLRTRVLLVDDDADIRSVTGALLDSLGYVVVEAEDGAGALAQLDGAAFDLLLVDYAMPGMTGVDVAREARKRHPALPVVFASGYADVVAIDHLPGPRSPLLRKPFSAEELQRVLAEVLARGTGAGPS